MVGVEIDMIVRDALSAPKPNDPKPIWFNIMVPDIAKTYSEAINEGCSEV